MRSIPNGTTRLSPGNQNRSAYRCGRPNASRTSSSLSGKAIPSTTAHTCPKRSRSQSSRLWPTLARNRASGSRLTRRWSGRREGGISAMTASSAASIGADPSPTRTRRNSRASSVNCPSIVSSAQPFHRRIASFRNDRRNQAGIPRCSSGRALTLLNCKPGSRMIPISGGAVKQAPRAIACFIHALGRLRRRFD